MSNIPEKLALQVMLQTALEWRGVRDKNGYPVDKYCFLSREEAKSVRYMKRTKAVGGTKVTIRIIG